MKPPRFEYVDPSTVDEAVKLLSEFGEDAKLLAGGQSLVPMMNFRLVRPRYVVDLDPIASLSGARVAVLHTMRPHSVASRRILDRAIDPSYPGPPRRVSLAGPMF